MSTSAVRVNLADAMAAWDDVDDGELSDVVPTAAAEGGGANKVSELQLC